MKIESIHIKNYKVFKDTKIENLPNMVVLLGANGSGKSTFFDVFGFLSETLRENATVAIKRRGGFSEVITRGCDINRDKISFEIRFRDEKNSPKTTYFVEIGHNGGKAIITSEWLRYRRAGRGRSWYFLKFENGKGSAIVNEAEYLKDDHIDPILMEQTVASPDILAIKGLGQFEQFKAISSFRNVLEKWYISNFKIDKGRDDSDMGVSEHLSVTGDNLAQITKYMYDNHRDVFDSILEKLPNRIPGISKVEAKDTEYGKIILRFQDEQFKDPFIARYVSDGTIKMFAYMILLNDPEPHPLLCIEEPENFLHPDLLEPLCEEIRLYSERGGQVFVSTHSPDFVNGASVNELYYIVKSNGYSSITAADNDETVKTIANDGNKLGWLWRNSYIKGANL